MNTLVNFEILEHTISDVFHLIYRIFILENVKSKPISIFSHLICFRIDNKSIIMHPQHNKMFTIMSRPESLFYHTNIIVGKVFLYKRVSHKIYGLLTYDPDVSDINVFIHHNNVFKFNISGDTYDPTATINEYT